MLEKADHSLASDAAWSARRTAWAKQLEPVLRERDEQPIRDLLAWVFGDQGGADFRFRVDSPKALRDKWDRIALAMRKPKNGLVVVGRGNGGSSNRGMSVAEILEYADQCEQEESKP